jgi:peroxiredoxin
MLSVGDRAPGLDLPLTTIDGDPTTLAELSAGKSLLLILLKTSCKSCKIGLPFASTVLKRIGDAPLAVVAVSQDSPNVSRSFRRRYEVDLPFVLDSDPYPLSVAYDIEATPSWFLINPEGEIIQTGLGVFRQPLNDLLASIAENVPGAPLLTVDDIDPELPGFVPACPSKHLSGPLTKDAVAW